MLLRGCRTKTHSVVMLDFDRFSGAFTFQTETFPTPTHILHHFGCFTFIKTITITITISITISIINVTIIIAVVVIVIVRRKRGLKIRGGRGGRGGWVGLFFVEIEAELEGFFLFFFLIGIVRVGIVGI